jgi:hypothetical protein
MPPLLTHAIPGFWLYIWLLLPMICIPLAIYSLLVEQLRVVKKESQFKSLIFLDIFLRLYLLLWLQTFFNYMTLLYRYQALNGDNYLQVIVDEYHLRTQTYCAFDTFASDAKSVLVFFSWI